MALFKLLLGLIVRCASLEQLAALVLRQCLGDLVDLRLERVRPVDFVCFELSDHLILLMVLHVQPNHFVLQVLISALGVTFDNDLRRQIDLGLERAALLGLLRQLLFLILLLLQERGLPLVELL